LVSKRHGSSIPDVKLCGTCGGQGGTGAGFLQVKLGLSVDKEDGMSCLIKGCNFLLKNISDEAFMYQWYGSPEYKFQNADPNIFLYLPVNIGSGVSIMKVVFTTLTVILLHVIIDCDRICGLVVRVPVS
jgi:pantothenate kinase